MTCWKSPQRYFFQLSQSDINRSNAGVDTVFWESAGTEKLFRTQTNKAETKSKSIHNYNTHLQDLLQKRLHSVAQEAPLIRGDVQCLLLEASDR